MDIAVTIKRDRQFIRNSVKLIEMLTDSLSILDVITKATATTERRLMIDLKTVKDFFIIVQKFRTLQMSDPSITLQMSLLWSRHAHFLKQH